jgi:hypothetical protein
MAPLDTGSVTLALLSLDNVQANKELLAGELAREFTSQCEELQKRLGYTAPNVPAITRDYDTLVARVAQVEGLLGVEVPCYEALMHVEQALGQIA